MAAKGGRRKVVGARKSGGAGCGGGRREYDEEVGEVVGRVGGGVEMGRRRRMFAVGEVYGDYCWCSLGVRAVIDFAKGNAADK